MCGSSLRGMPASHGLSLSTSSTAPREYPHWTRTTQHWSLHFFRNILHILQTQKLPEWPSLGLHPPVGCSLGGSALERPAPSPPAASSSCKHTRAPYSRGPRPRFRRCPSLSSGCRVACKAGTQSLSPPLQPRFSPGWPPEISIFSHIPSLSSAAPPTSRTRKPSLLGVSTQVAQQTPCCPSLLPFPPCPPPLLPPPFSRSSAPSCSLLPPPPSFPPPFYSPSPPSLLRILAPRAPPPWGTPSPSPVPGQMCPFNHPTEDCKLHLCFVLLRALSAVRYSAQLLSSVRLICFLCLSPGI